MAKQSQRRRQGGDSWLEILRIERTTFSQDELAFHCGIPRATYQRWITGKTEVKLTIPQLKTLCKVLGIEKVSELPDEELEAIEENANPTDLG